MVLLEVNEKGELTLPPDLVRAAPHTRLTAERQGEAVVLRPADAARSRFHLNGFPALSGDPTAGDPTMTFRREDLYIDEDR